MVTRVAPPGARGLLAALGVLQSCLIFADTARLPTLEDLDIGYTGSTIDLSPDNTMLAVESNDRLLVLSYPAGTVIANLGIGWRPRWAPDNGKLAFYSTRAQGVGSDEMQIFTWQRKGQIEQLTHMPGGIDPDFQSRFMGASTDALQYQWSADAKTIVFASRVRSSGNTPADDAPLILTNTTAPNVTWSGVCRVPAICSAEIRMVGRNLIEDVTDARNPLVNQLFLVQVVTKQVSQLTTTDRVYHSPIWVSDGSAVLAASFVPKNGVGNIGTAYSSLSAAPNGQIVSINVTSKKVTVLFDNVGAARHLTLNKNGDALYFATSEKFITGAHLKIGDLTSGQLRGGPQSGPILSLGRNGSDDIVIAHRQGAKTLLATISGDEPRLAGTPIADLGYGAWTQDAAGGFTWIGDRSTVSILTSAQSQPKKIFEFRPSNLKLGVGAVMTWRNTRGDTLTGHVLYPPDYRAGLRYPLIVDAYPLAGPNGWMHSIGGNQTWAAAGYVVFMPGERAPHVWMNAVDPGHGAPGKGPSGFDVALDDVMSGIESLSAQGVIDPDRMCIYGHSNGGGAASYLVTMTDRFKCAVVSAPAMANWVSSASMQTDGRTAINDFSGGMDFNHDIAGFVKISAVFNLYKSKTPMLIVSGDEDTALVDAISIFNAVRDAGTPVTLVRYPRQGHVLAGAAMRDFWARQMAFFQQYLKEGSAGAESQSPPATAPQPNRTHVPKTSPASADHPH